MTGVAPDGDGAANDGAAAEASSGDGAVVDPFCATAGNRLTINGQQVMPTSVTARVVVTNLCHTHTFHVKVASNAGRVLDLYACLHGTHNDTAIKMNELPNHEVRAMASPCGSSNCTLHHQQDAIFKGQATFALAGSYPGASVDLCITAKANTGSASTLRSFQLSTRGIKMKHTCTVGSDPSCNHNLLLSVTCGKCNPDGSCSCLSGFKKVLISGKCHPVH